MRQLLIALCSICFFQNAQAVEIFTWNRVPLPIQLAVGHERIVFIDRNVSVGSPRSLQGQLRIQSVAGAIYLLANEPIAPSRIQLKDAESGEIILLDIATVEAAAPLEPAKVVTAPAAKNGSKQADEDVTPPQPPRKSPIPVALTRYAAQMLYAPLRTVEALPGVRQVPVRLQGHLSTLAPTLDIDAIPLGSWNLDQWTVTAIRITNRRKSSTRLDPRHLQGDLYAATFQHSELGPAGTAEDTTTAYLVTLGKPLHLSLIPATAEDGESDE